MIKNQESKRYPLSAIRYPLLFLSFVFCILSFINAYASDKVGEELKLYLGSVKAISVNTLTRVVIGNPNVVDVTDITKDQITLVPKSAGVTTFVIWDNSGEKPYHIKVLAEDLTETKQRIDNLLSKLDLPGISTKIEEDENKIFISGRVKTASDRERITTVLGPLKGKTVDLIEVKEEEAVIEIDVQAIELDKTSENTLGLTWPTSVSLTEMGSKGITTPTKWSTVFKVLSFERNAFVFKLDALVTEGKARILSRPRLACQSGKEAELLVGGEVPIFTTSVSTGGTSTSVEYKEYGIKLKIKPTLAEKAQVKLALNVDVSELGIPEIIGSATAPTAKAYPVTKRSTSTELFLDDGQTMAIGGLIRQKGANAINKVPGLGNIPFFGALFRQKVVSKGGTELFIILTPRIVSKPSEITSAPEAQPKVALEAVAQPTKAQPPISKVPEINEVNLDPKTRYARIVQRRVLDNLVYPDAGRQAGLQGVVKLSLRISYDGTLLETKIEKSSGNELLDNNALKTIEGIATYPPFPPAVEEKELWIDIPINYQL